MSPGRPTSFTPSATSTSATSRPTNEIPAGSSHLGALVGYLENLANGIADGHFNAFDLVMHGDVFDFWTSIPDPLDDGATFPMHTTADYMKRFEEILDNPAHKAVWNAMARILWAWDDANGRHLEAGASIYILAGNHDDPISFEIGAALARKMIFERIVAEETKRRGTVEAESRSWMLPRFHVGATNYANGFLGTHIEHGHFLDHHNLRRLDGAMQHIAQGQIIVEDFLNGCHDLNLKSIKYFWERTYAAGGAATGTLQGAMSLINNFSQNAHGKLFVEKVAEAAQIPEVGEALRRQTLLTLWNAGDELRSAVSTAEMPLIGRLAEEVYKVLYREDKKPEQRARAQSIFGSAIPFSPNSMPDRNRPCKIVVMGHTHNEDFHPAPQTSAVDNQFVNTSTWIEARVIDPPFDQNLLRPRVQNAKFPVKIWIDPAQPQYYSVEAREYGGPLVYRNLVRTT